MLEVTAIPALKDNYIWLIHGPDDPRRVVIVDPGESAPVLAALEERGLEADAVFVTHHHPDHIGGVASLVEQLDLPVYGPSQEAQAVVTQPLDDRNTVKLDRLGLGFEALHIPGHTLGHTAFFGHGALFCGDTLFSGGCGRLFEGTAEQMSTSLQRLSDLPGETRIYCGHEYTAANLAFAQAVEPDNTVIASYREEAAAMQQQGHPTLPSRMDLEKAVNPFLRTAETSVRRSAEQWSGAELNDKVRVFAALRRWKDRFA